MGQGINLAHGVLVQLMAAAVHQRNSILVGSVVNPTVLFRSLTACSRLYYWGVCVRALLKCNYLVVFLVFYDGKFKIFF